MNKDFVFKLFAAAVIFGACSKHDSDELCQENMPATSVTFQIDTFVSTSQAVVPGTRTTVSPNAGYSVTWASGDALGIFPEDGCQVPFNIKNKHVGQASAQFDGGYWAIKDGYKYNAYYPFNRDLGLKEHIETHIPISYIGQEQTGLNCNVGSYDYTYSDWNTANSGSVSFQFHHIGAIIELTLDSVKSESYDSLTLVAGIPIIPMTGYYDLTAQTPSFIADSCSKTSSLKIKLNNFSNFIGQTVKVYFMMPPVDLTSTTLQAKLYFGNKAYKYDLAPSKVEASKIVRLTGKLVIHEYVDLGLSVKWATTNIGAAFPEDYGDYFMWGEVIPATNTGWEYYKHCNGSGESLTKYCQQSEHGYNGYTDSRNVLEPDDDAAVVNWGGDWRMPTVDEVNELRYNCSWQWYPSGNTVFNGIAGYKVTSNKSGYEGNFIFLPASGNKEGSYVWNIGGEGFYWTSSIPSYFTNHTYAGEYRFNENDPAGVGEFARRAGLPIRPVCP